ncbi:MAG: class II aldolase/adducin family protein [Calditrichaeota bacterium]|nr:class II aldolase/adducin family protein [Calditrichota bacterium]
MTPISESSARREVIAVGKRMYEKNFVVATDGNLSVRLGRGRFLVTRSGICKGDLTDRDLVICDEFGNTIRGGRVSSEVLLHLAAYRLRPDVLAAIHAHPPYAVAFTLAGESLADALLPEVVMSLGSIPTTLFAAPASPEGADVIKEAIGKHDAVILDRHGSLTVGTTLWEAYHKLERLEFAARVTHSARLLGPVRPLSPQEMAQVQSSLERYRSGAAKPAKPRFTISGRYTPALKPRSPLESIVDADIERLAPLVRRIIEEGRM